MIHHLELKKKIGTTLKHSLGHAPNMPMKSSSFYQITVCENNRKGLILAKMLLSLKTVSKTKKSEFETVSYQSHLTIFNGIKKQQSIF